MSQTSHNQSKFAPGDNYPLRVFGSINASQCITALNVTAAVTAADPLFKILASADDPTFVEFQVHVSTAIAGSTPVIGIGNAPDDNQWLTVTNTDEATSTSLRVFTQDQEIFIGLASGTVNAGVVDIVVTIKA